MKTEKTLSAKIKEMFDTNLNYIAQAFPEQGETEGKEYLFCQPMCCVRFFAKANFSYQRSGYQTGSGKAWKTKSPVGVCAHCETATPLKPSMEEPRPEQGLLPSLALIPDREESDLEMARRMR